MAFVCRDLDETTVAVTEAVIAERFCPEAFAMTQKMLSNPLRAPGDDIGVVVFDGDRVAGVTGSIVRRLYFRREPFIGINGGLLAMRRDAPATLLYVLLRQAHRPRFGSSLFFSNTCSPATARMKPCVGVGNQGPESWLSTHFARLHRYPSFRRRVKRGLGLLLPERLPFMPSPVSPLACVKSGRSFAADVRRGIAVRIRSGFSWADDFFDRYLKGNEGVVASRTSAELTWLFGDRVAEGSSVLLVAEGPDGDVGYLVAGPCPYDGSRWMVVDAIAIGNDRDVLVALFKAAKRAVGACSDAERLEVIGFPMWLQPIIAKEFPKSRPMPCNGFMWGFSDAALGQRCGLDSLGEKGWFFGPYDGDFCLCQQ